MFHNSETKTILVIKELSERKWYSTITEIPFSSVSSIEFRLHNNEGSGFASSLTFAKFPLRPALNVGPCLPSRWIQVGVPANQRKGLIGEDSDWSHFLLHLLPSVPVLGQLPESVAGTTSPLKGLAKTEARESDPEKR